MGLAVQQTLSNPCFATWQLYELEQVASPSEPQFPEL